MIPFFQPPSLRLPWVGVEIHAFGVLVAVGIILGVQQVTRRGRQLGFEPLAMQGMSTAGIVTGFVVSHLFDVIFYQPQALRENWLILFNPAAGLSSFGGFLGGLIGVVVWTRFNRAPLLAVADAAIFGLSTGWLFGRIGCFTAHDHPGLPTDFFLGVDFGLRDPGGVRHDLGFYEAIFTLLLVVALRLLARAPRRPGFYVALVTLAYAPVRFGLDFLRVADQRYLGLTPGQYGSLALFAVGLVVALRLARTPETPPAPPAPPATTPSPGPENGAIRAG